MVSLAYVSSFWLSWSLLHALFCSCACPPTRSRDAMCITPCFLFFLRAANSRAGWASKRRRGMPGTGSRCSSPSRCGATIIFVNLPSSTMCIYSMWWVSSLITQNHPEIKNKTQEQKTRATYLCANSTPFCTYVRPAWVFSTIFAVPLLLPSDHVLLFCYSKSQVSCAVLQFGSCFLGAVNMVSRIRSGQIRSGANFMI